MFQMWSRPVCYPRVSQDRVGLLYFCLCLCVHVIVCMRIVAFYLHSKELKRVSRLTQQLMVNLAFLSHSPTHDLSIFLLFQTNIQACYCTEKMCRYLKVLMDLEVNFVCKEEMFICLFIGCCGWLFDQVEKKTRQSLEKGLMLSSHSKTFQPFTKSIQYLPVQIKTRNITAGKSNAVYIFLTPKEIG